ncbi:MAG: phosphoadenosine phosphosulfate reductase family protein [Peptostreptococcaceae bacterium]
MNLIFNEYIGFLEDKGIALDLQEGYYWMDRQIIKAFDKNGDVHKIARIFTDDDLQVSCKLYKNKEFEIESWQDTVERNKDRLAELEDVAISKIKSYSEKYSGYDITVPTSGGKDSSVTLFITRLVYPQAQGIFNNTSLDCADTYRHIKTWENVLTINPDEGFYQWRERNNFVGNRMARACCDIFKEGAMVKKYDNEKKTLFFMGMRNDESTTRSSYEDEWHNNKWTDNWMAILPIREWTELDIWLYILWRGVPINSKYNKGYARVGCAISCPYYTKSTWVLDEYWYPNMRKRWMDIIHDDFIDNNKWLIMNCTLKEYYTCWNGGTYRSEPTDEVIKEYAEHSGLEFDVAKNYFGHICCKCDGKKPKKIKNKDVLAMNMKFVGRNGKYMCKKHLKEYLGIDEEKWIQYIKEFKANGCNLF